MNSPLLNQIAGVFLPVSDVVKARAWYSRILGLSEDLEILFGHLCCFPMKGTPLAGHHAEMARSRPGVHFQDG